MTEVTRTINNINELSTTQSDITSLQESVNNNSTNITTLQSYTVSNGTNFGVGPGVLGNLTTGTQNTVVGNLKGALPYTITSGSNNTFISFNAGVSCEQGSNNTFVGASVQLTPGQTLFSGSIGIGSGTIVSNSNQFVVASNVTSFIIPGLTASMGTREGTILEFDSSGYIIPSAGTCNTVSKIDTAISALQSNNVSTTGPFVPTFSSEVNCTVTSVNSGYSYYGKDFYNLYMLFTVDVTGSSVSSFSLDVSDIPGEYNTDFTPTAIVSVSGGTSLYHNVAWSFSAGSATISLSFTSCHSQALFCDL